MDKKNLAYGRHVPAHATAPAVAPDPFSAAPLTATTAAPPPGAPPASAAAPSSASPAQACPASLPAASFVTSCKIRTKASPFSLCNFS